MTKTTWKQTSWALMAFDRNGICQYTVSTSRFDKTEGYYTVLVCIPKHTYACYADSIEAAMRWVEKQMAMEISLTEKVKAVFESVVERVKAAFNFVFKGE